MDISTQEQIFQAMRLPAFYPHPAGRLKTIDTHISKVFLAGDYVYKVKKPVDLGFLDFSTLEKRGFYCDREVCLNRRLTSGVYLDVVPITRKGDGFDLGGSGDAVEFAVRMRRLADEAMLRHRVAGNAVTLREMDRLGRLLAGFYQESPPKPASSSRDVWSNMMEACLENFRQTRDCSGTLFDREAWETIEGATLAFLENRRHCFDRRSREGRVRDCHGDLRTDHIYFTDQGIQIIDCIEFNDRLRHIDAASDLAFLLMDLDFLGRPDLGDRVLDEYLKETGDHQAFQVLSFYKCYRAFVRCKVNCIFLRDSRLDREKRRKAHLDALTYFNLACRYVLDFFRPALWVVCGMPASGKSTVASRLSDILEIPVFHSDRERKAMFGLSPLENGEAALGDRLYSEQATALTYGRLLGLAQETIDHGGSVILDATYSRERYRRDVTGLAADKGIRVFFIECRADDDRLRRRLARREAGPSASDARLRHFVMLKERYESFTEPDTGRRILADTGQPAEATIRRLLIDMFRADPDAGEKQARGLVETGMQSGSDPAVNIREHPCMISQA